MGCALSKTIRLGKRQSMLSSFVSCISAIMAPLHISPLIRHLFSEKIKRLIYCIIHDVIFCIGYNVIIYLRHKLLTLYKILTILLYIFFPYQLITNFPILFFSNPSHGEKSLLSVHKSINNCISLPLSALKI